MKATSLLTCLLLIHAVHASGATNVTLYQTSFESPAFTPGLPLRGQDNWEMFHDGEAISVSLSNARSGVQCLRFDGALLEQVGPNAATAYCFSRALDPLTNNPPPIIEITASVRLDGPQTGTNGTPDQDILSANLVAVVPKTEDVGEALGGFFVSSAGRIWTYSGAAADNYKFSVPYTFGTYRTLKLRVDFVARNLRYFVDGVYLGLVNFPSSIASDRLVSGYLQLNGPVEPIRTPELTYDATNYTAYFDDYSLVSVPLSPVNAIIEFASTNVLADEFMPTAKLNVTRRGFTSAAVRVTVSTTNGAAVAGEDYEAVSTFVTFAAGETNKVVDVPLRDDYFAEPDRAFTAHIIDLPPGATSGKPMTRVVVRDDERPGSIDFSWSSRYGLPPLGPGEVRFAVPQYFPIPVQADGKLIVSHDVETPTSGPQFFRVVRLNTDGSLDSTFPPIQSSRFLTAYLLFDGRILITEDAFPRGQRVFCRNPDGTPNSTFTASITNNWIAFKGLPDGKILAYGDSIAVNGQAPRNLLRLNYDGSVDTTFVPPLTVPPYIAAFPLPDGKVLLPGLGGPTPTGWLLNTNGSIDSSFHATADGSVSSLIAQADGKIILGGFFTNFNGQLRNSIVRLNPNGSLDPTFATGQGFTVRDFTGGRAPAYVTIHALPGGRILVSDAFDQFDGKPVTSPVVLYPDGSRDTSFEAPVIETSAYVLDNFIYVLGIMDGQPLYFRDYGLGRLRIDFPLRIVSTARDASGGTHIAANALSGRSYTLQSSENLTHWTDLITESATTNRIEFTDPPASSAGMRFYRAKQQ